MSCGQALRAVELQVVLLQAGALKRAHSSCGVAVATVDCSQPILAIDVWVVVITGHEQIEPWPLWLRDEVSVL
jgi:hypothetical protein